MAGGSEITVDEGKILGYLKGHLAVKIEGSKIPCH